MSALRQRLPIVVLALLVFLGVPSLVDFYADWLWFGETGYQEVFLKALTTQATLALAVFALAFVAVTLNLVIALRAAPRREFVVVTPDGPRVVAVDPRRLRPIVYLAGLFAGLVAAGYGGAHWDEWLFYRHATPFGTADPVFGRDVAFYVFSLPFFEFLQSLGFVLTALTLALVVGAYVMAGAVKIDVVRGFSATKAAVRHVSILAGVLFLMLAAGNWLGQASLLTSNSGIVHGASYVDVEARLPILKALVFLALAGAGVTLAQAVVGRLWPVIVAVGLYFVAVIGGGVYSSVIQRFVVAPNEQARETPFIIHNIEATRRAFGLDGVSERELSGDALLSRRDIEQNAVTLRNVPLWDHQPLLDTFGQIQEIRTYYDFVSVNNDRYRINGEYRQIMLSPRELNSSSLPNRTWINERLTFTHGYGLALGPVNQVTSEGLPVLFIKNLPPESSVDLEVTEPSIYYGELSNDHVFVRTRTREFHYPKGDDNVYTSYTGDGGVGVGTFWRKVLFSIKFRSIKTLLSDDLTPESRVLYYRQVGERIRKVAPFLTYDPDRYISIADGRLFWIQDAYTTTARYPYSTPAGEDALNYIRNSIKATVDAYHGRVVFYQVDAADPIAITIGKMFPGLLRPLEEMPEGLRTRLRYPQAIFQIQAAMFSTYHMTNPAVFYNKEDQWEVPSIEATAGQAFRLLPWYTIMKLPGEREAEFIQMLPFTPRQKDNLAAWMVARSDHPNYGRLTVFQFPKQKVVFGPRQVVARINQDQVISPQITLWNQQGSEVIQGNLLVIPIEESLVYVRPLYLRSAGGKIPELKRVIVAYQNIIVMEETLEQALNRIFPPGSGARVVTGLPETTVAPPTMTSEPGVKPDAETAAAQPAVAAPAPGAPTPPMPGPGASQEEIAAEALATYQRAMQAQRDGNWALYGEEWKRLGELLARLRK